LGELIEAVGAGGCLFVWGLAAVPVVTSPFLLSGDWSGECCAQLKESHVF